jgi:alpha-beta hydrolase superfamily lysophospholipase
VIVDITTKGNRATQRLATDRGALPLINLAFSFLDLATRNVRGDSADVSFFLITGGQTIKTKIRRLAADSMVLSMAGIDLVMKTDPAGRILNGRVPSQNVTFDRVANASVRLTESRPDYSAPANADYTAEDVVIPTSEGHKLAGTLTLPKKRNRPVPVVVTISGSGLQNRDEVIPGVAGYRPFRQIAEALSARGVAVLRYDDRGFGASGGNAAAATTADFGNDVRAALEYVRTRSEIDSTNLFLLGHSEGAVIAPAVAAAGTNVRGLVLLAGTARTGRKIIEYQNRYGIDLRPNLSAAQRDSLYRSAMVQLDSLAQHQPWIRYFLDYDPLTAARKVGAPVLILQGATDRQVTADQAEELAAAFRAGRNRDVTVRVLPDVNHLFLRDANGNPAGYGGLPDKRVVAEAMKAIEDWILTHVK